MASSNDKKWALERTGSFVLTSIIVFTNSLQGEVKITGWKSVYEPTLLI